MSELIREALRQYERTQWWDDVNSGNSPASVEARGIQLVTSREVEAILIETLTEKFGWSRIS